MPVACKWASKWSSDTLWCAYIGLKWSEKGSKALTKERNKLEKLKHLYMYSYHKYEPEHEREWGKAIQVDQTSAPWKALSQWYLRKLKTRSCYHSKLQSNVNLLSIGTKTVCVYGQLPHLFSSTVKPVWLVQSPHKTPEKKVHCISPVEKVHKAFPYPNMQHLNDKPSLLEVHSSFWDAGLYTVTQVTS